MDVRTLVNSTMIRNMVTELIHGPMVKSMKDIGKMANRMEMGFLQVQKGFKGKEYGVMGTG
jgi:hypothetical protein